MMPLCDMVFRGGSFLILPGLPLVSIVSIESVISRLRTSAKFPRVYTRTKRYCSFINYALNNYQPTT